MVPRNKIPVGPRPLGWLYEEFFATGYDISKPPSFPFRGLVDQQNARKCSLASYFRHLRYCYYYCKVKLATATIELKIPLQKWPQ